MTEEEQREVDYLFKLKKSSFGEETYPSISLQIWLEKSHEGFEAFASELITWKTPPR